MSDAPNFDVHEIGDATVIRFRTRVLDELTAQAMADELIRRVNQSTPKKLLLNFQRVEYLSSPALGKLINLHKHITSKGGRFSFCNVPPHIFETFGLTKLDKFWRIEPCPPYPDEDDSDGNLGGVPARLKPPKPSGGGTVSLPPPRSAEE
jgi:anti-sigma B factor antagonist